MRNPGWNHCCLAHLQPPRLVAEGDVERSVDDDEYLFLFVCMQRRLRPWFVSGEADHEAASQQRLQNQSFRDGHLGKLSNCHEPARERGVSSVVRRTEVGIRLYPRSLFSVLQDAHDATASRRKRVAVRPEEAEAGGRPVASRDSARSLRETEAVESPLRGER